MKTRLAVGLLVLATGGALLFYFLVLPAMLSSSYEERAEPAHRDLQRALSRALSTFTEPALGGPPALPVDRISPGRYLRAHTRATRTDLGRLGRARRAVRSAEDTVERVEDDLKAPHWPLLDGRGDMAAVNDIADEEAAYLDLARRYLREYSEVLEWAVARARLLHAVEEAITGRAAEAIGSGTAFSHQRAAREARSALRRFRRREPPRLTRAEHANLVAQVEFRIRDLRLRARPAAAVALGTVLEVDAGFARTWLRFDGRSYANLVRLTGRSSLARARDELDTAGVEILRAYTEL